MIMVLKIIINNIGNKDYALLRNKHRRQNNRLHCVRNSMIISKIVT